MRALSISTEGFGSQNSAIRNKLAARLERDGITVLPDQQYPQLYLTDEGASSDFNIGYTMHSVYGTYVVLVIVQSLLLNGGLVKASTYRVHRLAAGLNTPSERMLNSVVDDFFTDWEKVNPLLPRLPSHTPQDGDLVKETVFTVDRNSDELKSSVFWNHDLQVQYDAANQNLFGDAAYHTLECIYKTAPHVTSADFWFKKAPPDSVELQNKFNPSIFSRYGVRPVEACPANLALAIKAKEMVKGEPPQTYSGPVTHYP